MTYSIMHAALLHTGKVLMLEHGTDTIIWNPDTPADPFTVLSKEMSGLTANLFCSGHAFLSDGKLLAVGGGGGGPGHPTSDQGWKFDPGTMRWEQTGRPMSYKRWYPTAVALGQPGKVLVASGWQMGRSTPAPEMEIYDEATDSFLPVTASGPVGEKLFKPTYPGLHLLPGGELFNAPTGFGNCTQTAIADSEMEPSGYFAPTSPTSGSWTDTGVNNRTKGMSALILRNADPKVRVLTVGGGDDGISGTAQVIDFTAASPSSTWDSHFPLLEKRVHPNVVLLPDGSVFISGGKTAEPVPPPNGGRSEMYDPDTGTVLEMDDLHHPRHYHSVALLLPSGKVMTAGGASDTGCSLSVQNTIEVFSPPYLFRGARPNIDDADDTASYGAPFRIRSRDAAGIDEVVLMRPMSVTHQTDTEQRRLELTFARSGDILTATAPRDGNAAPAGFYLLFLLKEGVPSEARWVQLRQSRAGRPRKSDLVVTDLRTTGPPTVNDRNSVEVPVQAVVRNQGNAPAGIFKVAAAYTDPATGRSNVVSFTVPGQSSVWYPYTSANLSLLATR